MGFLPFLSLSVRIKSDSESIFTSNNSIRRSPRGSINFVISRIAFISRSFLSSFDTPQYGVMSPTIDSAKSWTNAGKFEGKNGLKLTSFQK